MGHAPKHHLSRPMEEGETRREYTLLSKRYGPTDIGRPLSRVRQWSWMRLSTVRSLLQDHGMPEDRVFEALMFRPCTLDAGVYMVASDSCLESHRRSWHDVVLVGDSGGESGQQPGEGMLVHEAEGHGPFGRGELRIRLERYEELAKDMSPKPVHIVNLQHTADYAGNAASGSDVVPSLLRHSILFERVSGKEIVPAQHLLIMGWPIPGWAPPRLASFFPFPDLVATEHNEADGKLTGNEMRHLAGNGWQWTSYTSFLLYILATSQLKSAQ